MDDVNKRIEWDFTNHTPNADGIATIEQNRLLAKQFAKQVATLPAGREQSLALTKIEEALFYANAAAARNLTDDKKG